jgi:hypothetical protein
MVMSKIIVAAALPIAVLLSSTPDTDKSNQDAIRQTALDYAEGWYEGDADRMERALHPDLAKRALMLDPRTGKGKIDHIGAMGLVQAVRKGYGTKTPTEQRRADVTILDVYGNAASVKVEMHDWIDYIHMSKLDGRWVIVNVLWEFSPDAKKKYGIPENL